MSELPETDQEVRMQGVGVSPGVSRAEAHIIRRGIIVPTPYLVAEEQLDAEWRRFEKALEATRIQLLELQQRIDSYGNGKEAGIFDAHLLFLEDAVLLQEVERTLRERGLNVAAAFYEVICRYEEAMGRIEDDYLRERVADLEDVAQRVLRNLRGEQAGEAEASAHAEHILIAHDLKASDTAAMDRNLVKAFVCELGSQTAHTAIIARSLGIPAVVGLSKATELVEFGADVLVDGYRGLVILNPTPATLSEYATLEEEQSAISDELKSLRDETTETLDGRRIILSANIEFLREVPVFKEQGAEGVGLYRTEFFYLRGEELPSEEEQTEAYTAVARETGEDGLIIRTFDVGGDKLPLERHLEPEPNPFLGWRGIRVSLGERGVFKTQLRSILRASAHGKVRIMFPMVASVAEVREAKGLLRECEEELLSEGHAFDERIEVGAMIEVPSAALTADLIAPEVDFFSIGTNDLTQYTIAVDRVNERVADLFQPMHPGVLRLMRMVVQAARGSGIWVGVCGETAGDVEYLPLLVGLDVDELSVGPRQVLRVRRAIRSLDAKECCALVDRLLVDAETEDIRRACREMASQRYPELMIREAGVGNPAESGVSE